MKNDTKIELQFPNWEYAMKKQRSRIATWEKETEK